MEKKKSNKKTKVALLLAVIALIGTIGYGVYSKFYTEKDFNSYATVYISEFNPQIDNDGGESYTYIGSASDSVGGFECYDGNTRVDDNSYGKSSLDGDIVCWKKVSFNNDGDKTVNLDITDTNGNALTIYNEEKNDTINGFSLTPDETKTVYLKTVFNTDDYISSTTNYNSTNYIVYDSITGMSSGYISNDIGYKVVAYEQ